MNLKRTLAKIFAIILFTIFSIAQIKCVYAHEQVPAVWMGIVPLMQDSTPLEGYSIGKPGSDGSSKIWNIVRYQSEEREEFEDADIYCVRAGLGFANDTLTESGNKKEKYDRYFDMLTERNAIRDQNTTLSNLVNGKYNELLALLDRLYLPQQETTDDARKELIFELIKSATDSHSPYNAHVDIMARAFNAEDIYELLDADSLAGYNLTQYALTENDISAVQQAAIWYFTNYDQSQKYDKKANTGWLYRSTTGVNSEYDSLENYNPNSGSDIQQNSVGQARAYQAEALYNYLIQEAEKNASKYQSGSDIGAPIKINETEVKRETSGEYYVIGPFNIQQLDSRPYKLSLEVKKRRK